MYSGVGPGFGLRRRSRHCCGSSVEQASKGAARNNENANTLHGAFHARGHAVRFVGLLEQRQNTQPRAMPRPPNGWLRAHGPAISCSSYGSHSSAAVRRALDDALLSRGRCPLQ